MLTLFLSIGACFFCIASAVLGYNVGYSRGQADGWYAALTSAIDEGEDEECETE